MGNTVFRQAYISRASESLTEEELNELEEKTLERCQRLGLCSLVIAMEGRVIQVMEGPERKVRRIMSRVIKDYSHHQIVSCFSAHPDQTPALLKPSVVVRHVREVPEDMMENLKRLATRFQWAKRNPTLSSQEIGFMKSLALFSFEPTYNDEKPAA